MIPGTRVWEIPLSVNRKMRISKRDAIFVDLTHSRHLRCRGRAFMLRWALGRPPMFFIPRLFVIADLGGQSIIGSAVVQQCGKQIWYHSVVWAKHSDITIRYQTSISEDTFRRVTNFAHSRKICNEFVILASRGRTVSSTPFSLLMYPMFCSPSFNHLIFYL